MQIIYEANIDLKSLFGKQKLKGNLSLDKSKASNFGHNFRHNYFLVKLRNEDESLVIFNNMTKSVVVLDANEAKAFDKRDFENGTVKWLFENWYIVPVDYVEAEAFTKIVELYKFIKNKKFNEKNINLFIILPTTNCNARCWYCFEEGCKKYSMDINRANDVADFIIKNNTSKKCEIRWFGGEPTICTNVIDTICKRLTDTGIDFKSSMITNAYLLDNSRVNKAVDLWHLNNIQVTIDGTEEVYNKTKAYIDAASKPNFSAFKHVLNNLELLMQNGIYVRVRLHITKDNEDDIIKLIHFLMERFKDYAGKSARDKQLFSMYVHSLYDDLDNAANDAEHANDLMQEFRQREIRLEKLIFENGFSCQSKLHRSVDLYCCMADNPNATIILPDGKLGVCESYVEGENTWGSIYSDKIDDKLLARWKELYPINDNCYNCAYFPSCKRLKMCPGSYKNCTQAEKDWRYTMLQMQLTRTYQKYKCTKVPVPNVNPRPALIT